MSFRIILFWVVSSLVVMSCKKEELKTTDPLPTVSHVPAILLGTMATTYNQFDDVVLYVNYIDGNGDLGFEDADTPVVYVTDNRNGIEFNFHVQPLSPPGVEIAIQGQLQVVIENVILLSQSNSSETVTFSVKIIDRAGNWSNLVTTPVLTINN
jgi:hypothetical protein